MPLFTLITLPDASSTLTGVGSYSTALFTDLYPFALMGVGLIVGGIAIAFLARKATKAVGIVAGGRRGGRRRR